jgi:hypothetical protein
MRPPPRAPDSGHYEVASDEGAENWAILASLIETCKLHRVNPQAYLADVLARLVNNWLGRRNPLIGDVNRPVNPAQPWRSRVAYDQEHAGGG